MDTKDDSSVCSEAEADILERMLKEAEVLAAKMTSVASGDNSGADLSSAHSKSTNVAGKDSQKADLDPLIAKAELMVQEMRNKSSSASVISVDDMTTGSVSLPTKEIENIGLTAISKQQQDEIDEVLRQSEALLDKIRSKGALDSRTSPVNTPAFDADASDTEAPSSVYVLHHNSNSDDVSSVGSGSLRTTGVASKSDPQHLAEALNRSRYMADTLKEMCSPADSKSFDRRQSPETPTPVAPDDVAVIDYTSVSVSSSTQAKRLIQAKLQTEIPDFTVTAPDAKWERVSSARQGDDDYVSIKDFTEEPVISRPVRAKPIVKPVKQSRLSTYRGQAKRDRERKQRMLLCSILVVFAIAYLCFGGSTTKDDSMTKGEIPSTDQSMGDVSIEAKSEDKSLNGELKVENDFIVKSGPEMQSVVNVEDDVNDFDHDERSNSQPEFENHIGDYDKDYSLSDELDELLPYKASAEESHPVDANDEEFMLEEEELVHTVMDKAHQKNPLKNNPEDITQEIEEQQQTNKPKCKHPLSRIFKKRCRMRAKEERNLLEKRRAVDEF